MPPVMVTIAVPKVAMPAKKGQEFFTSFTRKVPQGTLENGIFYLM